MNRYSTMKGALPVAAALVMLSSGCDLNDLDEVQNGSNEAVIRAQFFESRVNRVPVAGVRMIVESDPDSERPYRGPDVVAISGEDGVAVSRVFPGFEDFQNNGNGGTGGGGTGGGGTGQQPLGPEDPLGLPAPLFFADVAVTVVHQGRIFAFIAGGLTIGSGRLFDLGPIFLDEFVVEAN